MSKSTKKNITVKKSLKKPSAQKQILEGSQAIALLIKNIEPAVISAYPITPQTHIVEDLAKFKADGQANYEYVRAESEFSAASIVLGAAAKGVRTYSATSSQGLLLMSEVVYNISGLRLPVVMTLANRALSAPINIWNDHSDAMALRDASWLMFFAENNQEALEQHLLAFKVAEKTNFPAFINVDGFILTHCYEPVYVPDKKTIRKFLPTYRPKKGRYLDSHNPITMGALMSPQYYQEAKEKAYQDFSLSLKEIEKEYLLLQKTLYPEKKINLKTNNAFFEYQGPKNPELLIIALGSVIGTIKNVIKENKFKKVAVLKIKTYRPFPAEQIYAIIKTAKNIAILEKALSPGNFSPLYLDIKSISSDQQIIKNFVSGLGGKDIKEEAIKKMINKFFAYKKINFI